MKAEKLILFLMQILSLLVLTVVPVVQADTAGNESRHNASFTPAAVSVSYDRVTDQLSIAADASALKSVLARVAQKSGIEVLFDDKADEPVSIDIRSASLEEGLRQLLKGRNHLMRYSRDEQQNLLLIGVMVLPAGEQDTGRAKRLVAMDDEAFYRSRSQLSLEQVQQMDVATERWQARLAELPPEHRDRLEKKVAARQFKQVQREQRRAAMEKRRKQLAAENGAWLQQQRELALKGLDPERRAVYEQKSAAARERMRLLLQKPPQ